jgi:hypothetical protein
VCLAVLYVRAPVDRRRALLGNAAIAAGVAAIPVLIYVGLNATVWDRPLWSGGGTISATASGKASSLREFASYLWQFYLPRAPFMTDLQANFPVRDVWLDGFIGHYGWLDTTFPARAYTLAHVAFAVVLVLFARALWRRRATLEARWGEPVGYLALVVGFLLVVAWAGYRGRLDSGAVFEQARYLLPLGALYAGIVALAARGAGRRLGPAVGAALVVLACGHGLMSVLLVVGRYYA